MTRIIAGVLGSMRLKGPAKSTRPTSDRVKESIFSVLESMGAIEDARVLDLYAGTGALGLEAASRGAASVTFVENNRDAAEVCKQNIETANKGLIENGFSPELQLSNSSAQAFLSRSEAFDVVFIDPPYDFPHTEVMAQIKKIFERNSSSLVVLERFSKSETPMLEALEIRTKNFGDTSVHFLTKGDAR